MPDLFTGDTLTAAFNAAQAVPPTDASPASDPSLAAPEATSGTDPATTPQAAADGSPGVTPPDAIVATDATLKGAPPETRWPTILENARQKAAAEVKGQYAWADTIPEAHRTTIAQLSQTLATEPVKAIEDLMVSAANDPVLAPQLRSLVGRYLRETNQESPDTPAAGAGSPLPEPDFQDEQGHTFYSAERMREALTALETKIAKELEPLKTDYLTRDARIRLAAEEARATRDADAWAKTRYAKVSQWSGFADHEPAIIAAMTANPELDIGDAYIEIVVPKLAVMERKKVVTSLQDKAAASSLNPSHPASAAAAPPKDFREGLLQMGVGG